jgi:hypothetical protein
MSHLKYLNVVLTALTLVLTLNLVVHVMDSPVSLTSEAHAAEARGVGSQAERQQAILNELESINTTVKAINTTLTSGDLRVKMDATPGSEK